MVLNNALPDYVKRPRNGNRDDRYACAGVFGPAATRFQWEMVRQNGPVEEPNDEVQWIAEERAARTAAVTEDVGNDAAARPRRSPPTAMSWPESTEACLSAMARR